RPLDFALERETLERGRSFEALQEGGHVTSTGGRIALPGAELSEHPKGITFLARALFQLLPQLGPALFGADPRVSLGQGPLGPVNRPVGVRPALRLLEGFAGIFGEASEAEERA